MHTIMLLCTLKVFLAHSPNTMKKLLVYSPAEIKEFQRVLRLRIKNKEYAERNFHFQQCLPTLKAQYFEKIDGIIYWPRKNN
jgi:hypothetical protein